MILVETWQEHDAGEVSRHGTAFMQRAFDHRRGRSGKSVLEEAVGHLVEGQADQGEVTSPAEPVSFSERQSVAAQQVEQRSNTCRKWQ